MILFVLALNPLSHLYRSTKGYAYCKNRQHQHPHNFFVDDLKSYATDMNMVKRQPEIVTTFLKDIGMKFGKDKCAFLHIEKGIIKKILPLNINHLTIQPVADGDSYKYLGRDENITHNGPLSKEKVSKEYLNRERKIWSSLRQHLLRNANKNEILGYVSEYEHAYIIRVGNEFLINNDITETLDAKPKSLSRKYTKAKAKEHEQQHTNKKMH